MKDIRDAQETHYRDLLAKHPDPVKAVSSESQAHKLMRFAEIAKLFGNDGNFSVHDVGMGMGAFHDYLCSHMTDRKFEYSGTEILPEFVERCKSRLPEKRVFCRDLAEGPGEDRYDYIVLSGVFHQRRSTPIPQWERFNQALLRNAWAMCRKGIAFNFISPFVDFYQAEVYYANLPKIINFVVDDLSRFFSINHSYALFEFTVCVFKDDHIASRHPEPEFAKYFARTKILD